MAHSAEKEAGFGPGFALKVDVDTYEGLKEGAPRLLDLFGRHGVRATWFVSMGPDRTGWAALRVFRQKGFLSKMVRSRAPGIYPWKTMLRGTLLPAIPIAASQPHRLREIREARQEIGIHGFDHVRWHDTLAQMDLASVRDEVARAADLFERILGSKPRAFAAPGWQCTAYSLRAVDELGVAFRSDTRGRAPYRPVVDGYVAKAPEIPTTLPTLDEMLGLRGRSERELTDFYLQQVRDDELNVHTVHTEVEGGPYLSHLDALLHRVKDRLPVITLGEVLAHLPGGDANLPVCEVSPGVLPGRGGTVACQEPQNERGAIGPEEHGAKRRAHAEGTEEGD
jgi:undecaprenyl phosphate-alpha-L-ara4FN deformylase